MPADLVKSFAKKTGKSVEDIEKMWKDVKVSLVKQGEDKAKDDFYGKLVGIMKKNLKLESDEEENDFLYKHFKNRSLFEDDDDEDYQSLIFFREVIETLMDVDDDDEDDYEPHPILEILYEVAEDIPEETRELIIEGIFDFYDADDLDDLTNGDDDDEDDEDDEDLDESMFEEGDFDFLVEVSTRKTKRLRYLKQNRRKKLGKKADSMQFKRTHMFDKNKRRFVKRKKAISVSEMRKKTRKFNKIKRKGATKARAKRTKKRLKNVKNPYK